MLRTGDAAPDFVLKDQRGDPVRLSSLRGGWVVVYFYPKDRTPGCTIEAKQFRDLYGEIQGMGATVLGISLDAESSHAGFCADLDLPFRLLSDPEGRIHDLYEAWRTTILGRNALGVRRCTYLIDEAGIIRRTYGSINPYAHARQVVKDLEALQQAATA